MKATAILREEHLWIRRMVDCLERLIERARESNEIDHETAGELLHLFATFSDKRHQEKEEVLFPHIRTLASSGETKLIRKVLGDHEEDQLQMMHMRSSLVGSSQGDPVGQSEFLRRSAEYVTLQRRHMAMENSVMLPLADRLLTSSQEEEILDAFERIEGRGEGAAVTYRKIAMLCERLGVPCEGP